MPRGPKKIVQSLASANPWFNDNVFSKANRLLQQQLDLSAKTLCKLNVGCTNSYLI